MSLPKGPISWSTHSDLLDEIDYLKAKGLTPLSGDGHLRPYAEKAQYLVGAEGLEPPTLSL